MENSGGGVKEKMKSFRRSLKGISPIFATLILIAIAVIAGVVVYMFTSGTLATMTGGGTAAQEKVSIQAVQGTKSVGLMVYAQSQSGTVTLDSVLLKDTSGAVVGAALPSSAITYNPAGGIGTTLNTITIADLSLASGTYTATLISTKGGNFVSPSFTVP